MDTEEPPNGSAVVQPKMSADEVWQRLSHYDYLTVNARISYYSLSVVDSDTFSLEIDYIVQFDVARWGWLQRVAFIFPQIERAGVRVHDVVTAPCPLSLDWSKIGRGATATSLVEASSLPSSPHPHYLELY